MQGSRRNPLDLAHPGRVFAVIALAILAVDQIAKALVRARMVPGQTIPLVPNVLNLTYVHNVGAAFGLFPGRQPVFIATSCFVLFVIAAYWRRAHPRQWPVVIALAMVSAGAIGNLIDRAVLGPVTDFFEFGFVEFPVFNVADMAIILGVAVLALWILFPAEEVAVGEGVAAEEGASESAAASDSGQPTGTPSEPEAAQPPASPDAPISHAMPPGATR